MSIRNVGMVRLLVSEAAFAALVEALRGENEEIAESVDVIRFPEGITFVRADAEALAHKHSTQVRFI